MEYLRVYISKYFILLCLSAVLYFNSTLRYRQHKIMSWCMIGITSIALILSVTNTLVLFGRETLNIPLVMACSYFGYTIRPLCLVLLIIMVGPKTKRLHKVLLIAPLIINAIIYIFAFIPATRDAVFYYFVSGNKTEFFGGPLRFSSHILSFIYLMYVMYISISKLRGKHITHGISVMFCAIFVILSVVIESFFSNDGSIDFLLNNTIVVSVVIFYLFLYTEKSQTDPLTGLFNRETYYQDTKRMGRFINGIIQFDMNGLKYLNDNFGHTEGDKALVTIGNIIFNNSTRKMYVYRLGGDEFTLLAVNTDEDTIKDVIGKIREDIKEAKYYCSIGYACANGRNIDIETLEKEAEEKMYLDKEEFYKNAKFERRKADHI